MHWDSKLYDTNHGFVSEYGSSLVELLNPKAGERILDLGCGTGDLAFEIAQFGCDVVGIDASGEMIAEAKQKYPEMVFEHADATSFELKENFDAVFSNAAMHWIPAEGHEKMLIQVNRHLKSGGRFVAEMGAAGNVEKIIKAVKTVLTKEGFEKEAKINIWYFPKEEEYINLLENTGFEVDFMQAFERPTKLTNEEKGLTQWLKMFGGKWFENMETKEKENILLKIQDYLYPDLFKNGEWVADYKRLRFCVYKNK